MTLDEVKAFPKEKLLELIGVPLSMARVKCALLALKVLKAGAYGIPDPEEIHGER
jgi:nitrogen fixation NifU-like protein